MFWKEVHFSGAEGPEGLGNARLPSLAGKHVRSTEAKRCGSAR